jgi:hypothetical protein
MGKSFKGFSQGQFIALSINRSQSGENPGAPTRILHESALPLTIARWFSSHTSAAITGFPGALALMKIAACAHPGSLFVAPSSQPTGLDPIASNPGGDTLGSRWGHGGVPLESRALGGNFAGFPSWKWVLPARKRERPPTPPAPWSSRHWGTAGLRVFRVRASAILILPMGRDKMVSVCSSCLLTAELGKTDRGSAGLSPCLLTCLGVIVAAEKKLGTCDVHLYCLSG